MISPHGIALSAAENGEILLRSSVGASIVVDREARVIRGVSVITAGATKTSANGIPPFQVDGTTLAQVAADINSATEGVKGHVTHPSVEDRDGIEVLAGYWRNARVDGGKVVADFHVGRFAEHSPSGANLAEFLFALAEEAPTHAGTSISAGQITFDGTGSSRALRLAGRLTSIDWTGEPAANPLGMFSAATDQQTTSTSLAVASPAMPAERATAMNWTEAQIAWLRGNGLDETATEAQVNELLDNLGDEAKELFRGLGKNSTATNPRGNTPAAKVTVRDAQPSTGGSGSANASAASEPAVTLATLTELNEIAQLAGMPGEWVTEMALSSRTPAEARKLAIAARKQDRSPLALGTRAPDIRVGEDLNLASLGQAVQDAIVLRANPGARLYQHEDPGVPGEVGGYVVLGADGRPVQRKPHERASQFRHRRVTEICREYLLSLGVKRAATWSPSQLASVALNKGRFREAIQSEGRGVVLSHSTGDFPYLLADAMGKALRAAYVAVPATWPFWCARRSAADFKDIKSLQLAEAPALDAMAHGEEYTFGTVTESRETYSLGKYGKGLSFTYESMVNDDLSAFDRIPAAMGRAAQRTEETVAIGILTANAVLSDSVALFATAHANLSTGALSATNGATSIAAARSKIMSQAPLGGTAAQPLGIAPKILLVPAALSVIAQQLVSSTIDPAGISGGLPMPAFIRQMMVLESALLDATSTVQYYAICDPADMAAVEFAQLEGEEGPSVREDTNLSNDTIQLTVRHYCAAKAVDYRPICRSSGA